MTEHVVCPSSAALAQCGRGASIQLSLPFHDSAAVQMQHVIGRYLQKWSASVPDLKAGPGIAVGWLQDHAARLHLMQLQRLIAQLHIATTSPWLTALPGPVVGLSGIDSTVYAQLQLKEALVPHISGGYACPCGCGDV